MQTEYFVMVASVSKRWGSNKNVIGNVDSFVLYNTILVSPSSELLYWARDHPKKSKFLLDHTSTILIYICIEKIYTRINYQQKGIILIKIARFSTAQRYALNQKSSGQENISFLRKPILSSRGRRRIVMRISHRDLNLDGFSCLFNTWMGRRYESDYCYIDCLS